MVDISSEGIGFSCRADENCPRLGQQVATRFSIPRFNSDKSFDSVSFNRLGRICRVGKPNNFLRCVGAQFATPLPFKPGEQQPSGSGKGRKSRAAVM